MRKQQLQGKVALITGASRGIGAAIARRIAAAGAITVCTARGAERGKMQSSMLAAVVDQIEGAGGTAYAVHCDLQNAAERANLIEQVSAMHGGIDILVNNAAYAEYARVGQVRLDSLCTQFEINVFAPFDLIQRVLPGMLAKNAGTIINISSSVATVPPGPPFSLNDRLRAPTRYASTKAALNRMTTGVAAELYGTGITVNSLAPMFAVRTETVNQILKHDPSITAEPSWQEEPPEAMAEAVLSLCCVDPDIATGKNLYSLDYLKEIGRSIRSLDGRRLRRRLKTLSPKEPREAANPL